jgi:uncharacterized delta-60 repeat protein
MAGLDLTFDIDGRVITDLGGDDSIRQLLSVGNGKILALASKFNNTTPPYGSETILVRYNSNGSLDTTFGTGGTLNTGLSYSSGSLITDDGKIIIVGRDGNGNASVIRYLANGQLDTSFATSGKYSESNSSFDEISIRKNPNNNTNEIIVNRRANSADNGSLLLDTNGQIKPFPIGGNTTATPFSLDLIVLSGIISSATINQTDPKVQTILSLLGEPLINELRATFNTPTLKYRISSVSTIAQSDGTILLNINGYPPSAGGKSLSVVAHFKADGTSDANFGINRLLKPLSDNVISSSILDKSDRFNEVVYDDTTKGNSVYRYTKDGRLDASFGTNGKLILPRIGDFRNSSIAIDSQNRIVVIENNYSDNILNITRLNNNGTIDTTFGTSGQLQLQSQAYIGPRNLLLGADDRLFIGGSTSIGDPTMGPPATDIIVTKYDISGTAALIPPVISFSTPDFNGANFSQEFAVNENGVPIERVTLIRNGNLNQAVSVTIKLGGDNFFNRPATPTLDFNAADIQVNFAANETIKTISIPIVDDNIADNNEAIRLSLANPTGGATLGNRSTATLTIVDSDLIGGAGNDTLDGTAGNEIISGLGGDDSITAGTGKDTIDGGTGNDYLSIGTYFNTDTVNTIIAYTTATNGLITGGSNNGTTFKNIERLNIITGYGADNIDISAASSGNSVASGAGNDIIKGGSGNDDIYSGTGRDTIDGGAGYDSFSIGRDTQSGGNYLDTDNTTIVYNTVTNGVITGGSNNGTTFKNIEELFVVTGSGDDNIDISATTATTPTSNFFVSGNYISSGAGNNIIKGGAGDDSIYSRTGNDRIDAGAGNDRIDSGSGNDTIDGGAGNDDLSIYNGSDTANTTIVYTAATNGLITGGSNNGTTFKNIETLNITTGSGADNIDISATTATANSGYSSGNSISSGAGNDIIKGGAGDDEIYSGTGNDSINGGAGDDNIASGTGNDTIDGGAGNDSLSISNSSDTANTTIAYTTATNGVITGGSNHGTTFKNIETLNITTGSGADNIDISATTATPANFGFYVGNSVSSGTGNDIIKGGAGDDRINSGTGNDTINSGNGGDTIDAGAGDDIINAGLGTDNVTGGTGNDLLIVNYSTDTGGISLNLTDNGTAGYSGFVSDNSFTNAVDFNGIERFDVTGGSGDDDLSGGKNNDVFKGGAGDDTLDGGLGADTFGFGGVGVTTVTGLGIDTISNFVANTDKIKLYKSTFSAISTAAGASIGTNFISVADDTLVAAQTAAIIYSRGSGGLFYNADAATPGSGANGGKFAILPTALTLSASDFVLVDDKINLSVAPASVTEDGVTNLVYTFTRTDINSPLTVNFTVGGTGTFNNDYVQTGATSFAATTGSVTFAAGAATAIVTVNPTADTVVEIDETVVLILASGNGYSIGTTTAFTGTIINDDTVPTISIADLTIVEGINGIPSQSLITVSLNKASAQAVTVNYATSNVTAIAGTDYTATTGTLTFAVGEISKTIAVPILNDILNEANETFEIILSTPTNATILDNKAIVTITDTLVTNLTTTLADLVENLTLSGTSAINGTGNAGNNVLTGNAANNTLAGLNGNDTYRYDADLVQGKDTISETSTGGSDSIDFTQTAIGVNINLGLTTAQTVNANLQLVIPVIAIDNVFSGSGNDRITGNILNNSLYGGTGDDRIFGAGGNDFILGQDGNDIIGGGDGNDIIYGQGGNDIITGGAGNDIFAYNGLLSGTITAPGLFGLDTISDFTSTQDKISLSKVSFGAITSLAGTAIGANFITVDDDSLVDTQGAAIVYSLSSGGLFYNQNGATAGYGTNGGEFANILGSAPLVANDFTIVA